MLDSNLNVAHIGIMQGRLVPPEAGRFQAFPRQRWRDEFALGAEVPVGYIEWIYDLHGSDVNPLTGDRDAMKQVCASSGVGINAICADYFMDLPFVRCSAAECAERQALLDQLLRFASEMGVRRVVLPFVDASRIESAEDSDTVVRVVNESLAEARRMRVEIHLETSLDPGAFAALLRRMPDSIVKVNYDSGNSASLGFRPGEEFAAYGDRVGSVHIKDRVRGGGTVPLGTGDADFPQLFSELERIGYTGDITMQVARGVPGQEVALARENRAFVARYWALE